ncbi:MAG: AarF/UbiB family protein [Leptospiraceae bacterium]|nr:AarF/UbiB family protein [Leptospiraceae bacterium]MCZ8345344.1 AarF/UbiB family protein [Leptospiraceae bacterium]
MNIFRTLSAYLFSFFIAIQLYFHYTIYKKFLNERSFELATKNKWSKISIQTKNKILNLGGIYIKLGQFLSNLNHLLPEEFIEPMQELQDRVPSKSYLEIFKRLELELGMSPEKFFDFIDKQALASASTAQVHFGRYKGRDVAIKVLYPGIEESILKDLKVIYHILKWINNLLISFPYQELFDQLHSLVQQEMDLSLERANTIEMRELFKNDPHIRIPLTLLDLPTKSILVTEFIYGLKITDPKFLAKNQKEKSTIADHLIQAYIKMVFRFRFFHADPHPGNFIIEPDGKICFIDFGAVARITPQEEEALVMILSSSLRSDYQGMVQGFDYLGILKPQTNRKNLIAIIEYSMQKMRRILSNIESFQNISLDVLNLKEDKIFLKKIQTSIHDLIAELNLPANYISLQRVLAQLVGNLALLDPNKSIFDYSERPFRELVLNGKNRLSLDFLWETFQALALEINRKLNELFNKNHL